MTTPRPNWYNAERVAVPGSVILSAWKAQREADRAAQDEWVAHVNDVAAATLMPQANSWYMGANVPGKPRVFMALPGFPVYTAVVDEIVADGYRGLVTT